MGQIALNLPISGLPNSTEDAKVVADFTILQNVINGNLDSNNIAATLGQSATVNVAGQTVKGATNIAASESRSNTAYGTLTTPDQVSGIVLPVNGLLVVAYHATWQESIAGAARAAIFLNSNQLQVYQTNVGDGPGTQAAAMGAGNAAKNVPLFSIGSGLGSRIPLSGSSADVTTGQAIGSGTEASIVQELAGSVVSTPSFNPSSGQCSIFAAAGTYTVSVQFKASSGSVTASNRKLWVQALSFA